MKRFSLLVLLASSAFGQASGQKVYVMPMAGGYDQHLAGWLARERVMQVVTDAKVAEVVLTDRLGEAFEQKLSILHPQEKPVAEKPGKDDKEKKVETAGGSSQPVAFRSNAARGTLFLVDVKTRTVVWSSYQKRRSGSDEQLNREAEVAVRELKASGSK